ncbi:MAG: TonB-dependent receptor [Ferruginibacter sp.]
MQFNNRIIKLLCLFLLYGTTVAAQQTFSGKVVDAQSRQPIESASVTDANVQNAKASSDKNGYFTIKSGKQVIVSSVGYKTTLAAFKENGEVIIALEPDAIDLKAVVIESNAAPKFSTLSKIDLQLKPVKNTQELLRTVPGLFIAQHAGGGKAEQIFLRGFDVDHGTDVQISVDGMPVNMVSHAHGQGYADAHFIIPETINTIDFGAGPYYAQHGDFNTAGYVAFSTFKNISKSLVQVETGRFNSFRTLAMFDLIKKNKDRQSAYIAADFNYTDGPTTDKQVFKRLNVFAKYNLAITPNTQLSASFSTFGSKWDASGQIPERAVADGTIDRFGSIDPTEGGNTERYNANLVLNHRFKNGANWENQVFYNRYTFNLFSNFTFFLNDTVNGDEIQQAEKRDILGYSSKLTQKYFFGNKMMSSAYGAGVRYDATKNSRLSNVVTRKFLSDIKLGDIKEANLYAFTQQQLSVGKWLFDAGVRVDYFHFDYFDKLTTAQLSSQNKAIVSPKLNIQYTVNKKLQLYVKGGKGFHSNDARVVVANGGNQILPAAYGTDIGVILKPTEKLYFNIAAWYLYLDQEFVYVGDAGVVEPGGKTKRQGIDVSARYQATKYLFANANFNITKARTIGELKGEDYIPLAPDFTSVGGIHYKKQTGLNGGISYRYIKDRPANEDNSITAKGYFLLDAAVNFTRPKYEIGFALENIFNVKWNEAQFATESQLRNEVAPVTELHYTPGTPFFARVKLAFFF